MSALDNLLHPNHRIVASPAVLNGEVHQDFELLKYVVRSAGGSSAFPNRSARRSVHRRWCQHRIGPINFWKKTLELADLRQIVDNNIGVVRVLN
jgi:hypothetical protein